MGIGRVFAPAAVRAEPAQETAEAVHLWGAGLLHQLRKETGEAALLSAEDGAPWVERESVGLERSSGGRRPRWQVVGGHRRAGAEQGRLVREVGGAAATCRAEYRSGPDEPLKVRFHLRAAQAGSYRVRWRLEGVRGSEVAGALAQGLRFADHRGFLEIAWADVVAAQGEVVSVERGEGGAEVVFGPFSLAAGEEVVLDPTIVAVYYTTCIAYPNQRSLARTAEGKLYACYTNMDANGRTQVYVKESADNGQNWGSETWVSTAPGQDSAESLTPAIAVDSRDDLHVVYVGTATGYSARQVWHAWRKDGGWQTPVRISTADGMSGTSQGAPAISVDAADDLHVVWHGPTSTYSNQQIWWATRIGRAWQAPQRLSDYSGMDSYAQQYGSLGADGEGGVHVAWFGKATGYTTASQVWYAEYLDGVWQTPVRISTYSGMDSYLQEVPSLGVDAEANLHVAWYGRATGYTGSHQVWYAKRTTSWQTPVRLSTAAGMDSKGQGFTSLEVGGPADLHVIWEGASTASPASSIFHSRWDGSAWSTPTALTGSGQHRRPTVRWASFHNRGASLDWIWLEGSILVFSSGGDSDQSVTSTNRKSQSFKATESRQLSQVQLYLKNDGTSRTATVAIYAADANGKPTGSSLGSVTATVGSSSYGWVGFNLWGQSINLTANSSYCMVCYPSAGTIYWYVDASSPTYADGNWAYSTDSGSSWTADTGKDGYFQVYPFFDIEFGQDTAYQPGDAAVMAATNYYYDPAGQQTAVRDGLGRLTTSAYDAAGRLIETCDPLGNRTSQVYDAAGRRSATIDPLNNRTSYAYDEAGRPTATIDPLNHRTSYYYDAAGRQIATRDPLGNLTTSVYDAAGRLQASVDPQNNRTTYLYDDAGQQIAVVDPLNQRTTQVYYETGWLKATVDALDHHTSFGYDGVGNRLTLTDPLNRVTSSSYDVVGREIETQDWRGYRTTQVYDAAGNRVASVDQLSNRSTFVYDAGGWLRASVDPLNQRSTQYYDEAGRQIGAQDALGNLTTSVYDAAGRLQASVDSQNNRTTYVYDGAGRQIATQDALGNLTTSVYDAAGRLQASVDPLNDRTSFVYDAAGNSQTVTDPLGRVTSFSYDSSRQLIGTENARGYWTTYVYDAADRRTALLDARGNRQTTVYDAAGQRTAQVNQLGERTSFSYDAAGRPTTITNPLGKVTSFAYAADGGSQAAIDALGYRTTQVFDAAGRVVATVDANGQISTVSYDALGRLAASTDANGYLTTQSYDAVSRRIAVLDPRGNRVSYSYDSRGLQVELLDPLGRRTSYGYDAAGRRAWRLDAKGQRVTYAYDTAGRLTGQQYSDGGRVTFAYDAAGNRTSLQDSGGRTTFSYDQTNALAAVVYPPSKALTYSYDEVGARSVLVDADGGRTTYSYDAANRLTSLLNSFAERTTFVYDGAGRPITQRNANGTWVSYSYDDAGRQTRVVNLKSDNSTLSTFLYTLDNAGNRTAALEASGDRVTYSYDSAYQLTRERRSGANAYDVTYSYDPVGNRLTKLEGGVTTSYSYDEASQLTVEWTPSARTTYTYDANGNTSLINAAGSLTTHTWDLEDRMTKVEVAGGAVNTMSYDGDGKRRRTEDSDGLRNVIWDQENIALETDSGNSTVAQYTLAPQGYGNLISQRRSGATSHYHFDALGSTRVLTNSAQTPTDTADYRAFGQPNASSGSTVNPFRWGGRTGYYRQGDSADYWLRARIYRDLLARFLSTDPLRRANPYSWPGNSPVMLADPSGLQGCTHGPGGSCPHHAPSAQGWQPATAGGGEGGHPHRHPCTPKSGCERRLTTNGDWYIMCRCKEADKRNWRCRCPHPEKWPRPPQQGLVQLVHVETCKSCSEKNDPCKCHFQLWRVPILPPRRGRRGQPFREEIVDGLCKPCGGGGGGVDDDGPDGPGECPPPHGEDYVTDTWQFNDALRPYYRVWVGGWEECVNLDLLSAMNPDIESWCTTYLKRGVQFIENTLRSGEARNVLSNNEPQTNNLNWHSYGTCWGWWFHNYIGGSVMFGRGCARRRGDEFTLQYVWSLEDNAKPPLHWLTARRRWTFAWRKGRFSGRCAFTPGPPPLVCADRLGENTDCGA